MRPQRKIISSVIDLFSIRNKAVLFVLAAFAAVSAFGQTASSVSLSSSPNPAILGQAVTLTATVTPGATGKVTFYDGSVVLGVVAVSSGQATLVTRELGFGMRRVTARYGGNGSYTAGVSAAQNVSVSAKAGGAFVASPILENSLGLRTSAVTDLNHDGFPDLVITGSYVISSDTAGVNVFLGNGDGTFQPRHGYVYGLTSLQSAVGDFDLDGTLDLVVTTTSGIVSLRGNGDGTFGNSTPVITATDLNIVRVADVNLDGKPDLLLSRNTGVEILLGSGDGTFQTQTPQDFVQSTAPSDLLVTDLNADGLSDLVIANRDDEAITVMLGIVGGGFGAPKSFYSSSPSALAAADLNGDGTLDLVIGTGDYPSVGIAFNHGDGTFSVITTLLLTAGPPSTDWASGSGIAMVTVYDFNGDNHPDIVSSSAYGTISVNYGVGDGTFQSHLQLFPIGLYPSVIADFNLDGIPDLIYGGSQVYLGRLSPTLTMTATPDTVMFGQSVTLTVNSNLPDATGTISFRYDRGFLPGPSQTVPLVNGIATFTYVPDGRGSNHINASYSGDSKYPATEVSSAFFQVLQPFGLSLTVSAQTITVGQTVVLTATTTPIPGNPRLSFYDGTTIINTQALYSVTATYKTVLSVGVHHLSAVLPSNDGIFPISSAIDVTVTAPLSLGQLASGTAYSTSPNATQTLALDFDGDNIVDLAILDPTAKNVTILLGKANGGFASPVQNGLSSVPGAMIASIGWYNDPILAITAPQDDSIFFLGCFCFSGLSPVKVGKQPVAIATADFDGDGLPDYITANAGSNDVSILPLMGANFYLHLPNIPAGNHPDAIVTADFNNDGKADFAVANRDDNTIMTFLGNGDDTFRPSIITNTGSAPAIMLTAELNGDSRGDLIVYDGGSNDVKILLGNGDGTFMNKATYPLGSLASAMILADVNGDGRQDLAITTLDSLLVFNGNSDGTFAAPTAFSQYAGSTGIAAGPFSGTGRLDLAISRQGLNSLVLVTNALPTSLSFQVSSTIASLNQPVTLTATVTPSNAAGSVSFYDGVRPVGGATIVNGSAAFSTSMLLPGLHSLTAHFAGLTGFLSSSSDTTASLTVTSSTEIGLAGPIIQSPTPIYANQLIPADFNNDGLVDFISGGFRVELGNGNGSFQEINNSSLSAFGPSVAADFNNDGKLDAMSGVIGLGNGTGNFTATFGAAESLQPGALADFDRDGRVDIAFIPAYYGYNRGVALALGLGDGIQAPRYFAIADLNPATVIASGDFNEDGKADIIAGDPGPSNGNGTLNVLLGNGDSSFGAPLISAITPQPIAVVTADFNHDGHLDIALADWDFNSVSILLGKGDGTFLTPVKIPLAGSPRQLIAADMNGDGISDLVIMFNGTAAAFAVLDGIGDGTFAPAVNYPALYAPTAIAVADMNRDGRMDVLLSEPNGLNGYLGAATSLSILQGANQSAVVGHVLSIALAVNAPVGATVTFSLPVGTVPQGGSFASGTFPGGATSVTVVANANGVAQAPALTANLMIGSYVVIASSPTAAGSLSFNETNVPGPPVSIVMGSGNQSATVGAQFRNPIFVRVLDSFGNGVPGVSVTVKAPSTGATATFFNAGTSFTNTTDVGGNIGYIVKAGTIAGIYQIVASSPSLSITATLSLRNTQVNISKSNAGVFRGGFYWLEDADGDRQFNAPPDRAFAFGGIAGDIPLTGDWNGSGTSKVGIYRPSNGLFILDSDGDGLLGPGDAVFNLGVGTQPGDVALVGDWNGNGLSKVGLFRQGFFWILDYDGNGVFEQNIDKTYAFGGVAGDIPVVGDWTGSGTTKIGLFRLGFYWILDTNGNGALDNINGNGGDQAFPFGGIAGDVPLVGDWNANGVSKVGLFRQGFFWVLDANGNRSFDGTASGQDLAFPFGGISGDKPVVGKW